MRYAQKINTNKFKIQTKEYRYRIIYSWWGYASFGVWTTTSTYSLSGAIIISCFFDRTRRKANSSLSSNVRTTPAAFSASCSQNESVTDKKCHEMSRRSRSKADKGSTRNKKNSGRDRVNRIEHNKTDLFRYEANTAEYATGCGAQQIQ